MQVQEFVATVEGRVVDCIQVRAGMGSGRVESGVRWEGCIAWKRRSCVRGHNRGAMREVYCRVRLAFNCSQL